MMHRTHSSPWRGRRVLVTGACGTVGKELIRYLATQGVREIVGVDNNESALFFMDNKYQDLRNARFYHCDICDLGSLSSLVAGVDTILHTAALKHVSLCERSPRSAVEANIAGVQNVIEAAQQHSVERVLFTSSDKAVNPTSVMGTTKLMGERLMTSAQAHQRNSRTVFASTRFGNVLGSRGSVIPLFQRQIAEGGPVTLTSKAMTRFVMTLEQAARLVTDSVFLARGGEVLATKMPSVRIEDLAVTMIEELAPLHGRDPQDIRVQVIGAKSGEKDYEELLSSEETRRTMELPNYYAILPAFRSEYRDIVYDYPGADGVVGRAQPYHSGKQEAMTRAELARFLRDAGLLEGSENRVDAGRQRLHATNHRAGANGQPAVTSASALQ